MPLEHLQRCLPRPLKHFPRCHPRLFWLEAKLGYIASVDWDGGRRKTIYVANNKQALPQPFAITMAAGVLFWTDWDTNGLYSYNISTDQVSASNFNKEAKRRPTKCDNF